MNAREQICSSVLEEMFEHGAYSNIALNQALEQSRLSDKDRSFVTEVVYGTVARKITLEWYLAHVIEDRTKLDQLALLSFDDEFLPTWLFGPYSRPCCGQ